MNQERTIEIIMPGGQVFYLNPSDISVMHATEGLMGWELLIWTTGNCDRQAIGLHGLRSREDAIALARRIVRGVERIGLSRYQMEEESDE